MEVSRVTLNSLQLVPAGRPEFEDRRPVSPEARGHGKDERGFGGGECDFRLERVETVRITNGNWSYRKPGSGSHVVLVASGGHGEMRKGGRVRALAPGMAVFLERGQPAEVDLQSVAEKTLYLFHASADETAEREFFAASDWFAGVPWSVRNPEALLALCATVASRGNERNAIGRLGSRAAFQELVYLVLKEGEESGVFSAAEAVERTKLYMEEHYCEPLTIQRLCGMARLNDKYYIKLFKKMYGTSPIEFLNARRLEVARHKLLLPAASVREVSRLVGYNDEFYFSRKFKQAEGVAPTAYMRSGTARIASYNYPITGQLLALQIMPCVAAYSPERPAASPAGLYGGIGPRLNDDSHDRETFWEPNCAALRAAAPDLIIGADYIDHGERDKLRSIASTFILDWCGSDWRDQLLCLADLVKRRSAAERWLGQYRRKVADVREHVRAKVADDTVLTLLVMESDYLVYGSRNLADVLYGDLGLRSPLPFTEVESVTAAHLAAFDADRIVLTVGDYPAAERKWAELERTAEWRSLRAVRGGRTYRVPLTPWFEYSATAHEEIVGQVNELFDEHSPFRLTNNVHGYLEKR